LLQAGVGQDAVEAADAGWAVGRAAQVGDDRGQRPLRVIPPQPRRQSDVLAGGFGGAFLVGLRAGALVPRPAVELAGVDPPEADPMLGVDGDALRLVVGALGLLPLVPGTARHPGVDLDDQLADPIEPAGDAGPHLVGQVGVVWAVRKAAARASG
jgi:hypothetical protein